MAAGRCTCRKLVHLCVHLLVYCTHLHILFMHMTPAGAVRCSGDEQPVHPLSIRPLSHVMLLYTYTYVLVPRIITANLLGSGLISIM